MGILSFIKSQLIEIIEWLDDSNDTLVWRFPDDDHEIKMGAKLTVRQGQAAVFVNEGQIADVFGPGLHTLSTQNMPVLTRIKGWKYGFESPFKAEIYFVNTKQYPDLKWGTKNPIMLRDADFGAVRLRAFGMYSLRVDDPKKFMEEIVGTDGHFTTDEIEETLKSRLISAFTHVLGASKVPALDLAANYMEIGTKAQGAMDLEFKSMGLALVKFTIENISLPPKLEKALDTRGEMGIIGNMGQYQQYQAANAMMAAANNPSGGNMAGAGVGLGAGMMMGQQMAGAMMPNMGGQGAPPPMPGMAAPNQVWHVGVNGQQVQMQTGQLQTAVQSGQVNAETLVWANGMPGWQKAGQVPQLASLFAAGSPPPMPGGAGGPPPMPEG